MAKDWKPRTSSNRRSTHALTSVQMECRTLHKTAEEALPAQFLLQIGAFHDGIRHDLVPRISTIRDIVKLWSLSLNTRLSNKTESGCNRVVSSMSRRSKRHKRAMAKNRNQHGSKTGKSNTGGREERGIGMFLSDALSGDLHEDHTRIFALEFVVKKLKNDRYLYAERRNMNISGGKL